MAIGLVSNLVSMLAYQATAITGRGMENHDLFNKGRGSIASQTSYQQSSNAHITAQSQFWDLAKHWSMQRPVPSKRLITAILYQGEKSRYHGNVGLWNQMFLASSPLDQDGPQ
ncbi:hypothetical protein V2G26_003144 [Clonostachys chloroleuca]